MTNNPAAAELMSLAHAIDSLEVPFVLPALQSDQVTAWLRARAQEIRGSHV